MEKNRIPMPGIDWVEVIGSIKIPKQESYVIIYSDMKDMIKLIIDKGGVEVERHNSGTELESITFKLS